MKKQKTYKGIVMEVTRDSIVLLCEEGTFKNIPRPSSDVPKIGDPFTYTEKARRRIPRLKYVSIAVIVLLVITSLSVLIPSQSKSAYVLAVDINPSLELYADKHLNVTEIKALNEDGEKIANAIEIKNKNLYNVLEEVLEQSIQQEYLQHLEQGNVTITVVPKTKQKESIEKAIEDVVAASLESHTVEADVSVKTGKSSVLEEAHKLNLSVNKYELYNELKEKGSKPDVETIRELPIGKVKEKYEPAAERVNSSEKENGKKQKEDHPEKGNSYKRSEQPQPQKPSPKKEKQTNNESEKNKNPQANKKGEENSPEKNNEKRGKSHQNNQNQKGKQGPQNHKNGNQGQGNGNR